MLPTSEVRLPWLLTVGADNVKPPTADKVAALEVPAVAALPFTIVPPAETESAPDDDTVPWFNTLCNADNARFKFGNAPLKPASAAAPAPVGSIVVSKPPLKFVMLSALIVAVVTADDVDNA